MGIMTGSRASRPIVVAERRLRAEGQRRPIIVRVMLPRPSRKGDWECQYQTLGLANGRVRAAYGLDAVQALVLAFGALTKAVRTSGLALTWEGGEPGDDGLPTFVPTFFGKAFSNRLTRLIERETEKSATSRIAVSGQGRLHRLRGKVAWRGDLRQTRSTRFRND